MRALVLVLLLVAPARADRGIHGSVGGGSSLALTGSRGDRVRWDIAIDLKPRSRYGVTLGWRQFDGEHRGLLVGALVFEGGASRPRFVLDLHLDAGVDLDETAPLAGAGVRATLAIADPLAVVLDLSGYLVFDGIDNSRFQLASSALVAIRW